MKRRYIYKGLVALLLTGPALLTGCNKWDDHNAITDPAAGKNLLQQIQENNNLSKFAELLTRSGYDKVIASSKTFTVFAPTNAALATLDAAIVSDTAKLRLFVGNHISNQSTTTIIAASLLRLPMLNGKYNNMLNNKLEDATITTADQYAKNGVLQIIDKMIPALPNTWEFVESGTLAPAKQKTYLLSLFRNVFDSTNAVQIGVDPNTGKPVYKPGTDSVRTNLYWRNVYDLRNESKQYTFFMLADNTWDTTVAKYFPYYKTGSTDSTQNLSNWATVKDFAVEGAYDATALPDTLLSRFNVKIGIEKSAIVQTIKTSNGFVHIMKKLDVPPVLKFRQYLIEAENYRSQNPDRRGNTYFRDRYNPLTGKDFRDVLVYGHTVAQLNLNYQLNGVPSMKFRAYWVALHDNVNNITANVSQKLSIGTPTSPDLPYVTVTPNNYSEVYLGEFTLPAYMPTLNVYLVGANNTTATTNFLVCDYIRLEPSF